jgi:hypothetical protein
VNGFWSVFLAAMWFFSAFILGNWAVMLAMDSGTYGNGTLFMLAIFLAVGAIADFAALITTVSSWGWFA